MKDLEYLDILEPACAKLTRGSPPDDDQILRESVVAIFLLHPRAPEVARQWAHLDVLAERVDSYCVYGAETWSRNEMSAYVALESAETQFSRLLESVCREITPTLKWITPPQKDN